MSLPIELEQALTEETSHQEILKQLGLSCEILGVFEGSPIQVPEALGVCLQATEKPIVVWVDKKTAKAGTAYMEMLDIPDQKYRIKSVDNSVVNAQTNQEGGFVSLVVNSAIDPNLKELMFENPEFGQLFADGIYLPIDGFESPLLFCVGITTDGLKELGPKIQQASQLDTNELARARSEVQKPFLRKDQITSWQFRHFLKGNKVKSVPIYALGPEGTNISQVAPLWVKSIGIDDKANIIITPRGIEPLRVNDQRGYVDIAAELAKEGIVPIHIECAVYYRQWELWEKRGRGEVVFADHHYMPLDKMMVAAPADLRQLDDKDRLIIAAHPSPKPLIDPWLALKHVAWKHASSNSAAAEMVASGEVDLCVTTGQSLAAFQDKLQPIHVFGSPMMAFTIGTPLSNQQLSAYL